MEVPLLFYSSSSSKVKMSSNVVLKILAISLASFKEGLYPAISKINYSFTSDIYKPDEFRLLHIVFLAEFMKLCS